MSCSNAISNSALPIAEIIRFDEHENPMTYNSGIIISPSVPANITMPETSSASTASGLYPPMNSPAGDVAGWMYLNLNSGLTTGGVNTVLHPAFPARASQNWVLISMFAEGRFGVDFDAAQLANGCTPPMGTVTPANPIAPGPNATP